MVLVPRVDGRYSTVGTITQIESAGELPNGTRALVIRGVGRARIGSGVPGEHGALHVEVEQLSDPPPTEATRALAHEYRAVVETILEHRGARRIADVLAGVDDPGQLADIAAYSPDLTLEQRVELLEAIDVEARLELAIGWMREVLADLELKDKIRNEVSDDLDKQQREMLLRRQMDAIRKELGDGGDDDIVAEYRAAPGRPASCPTPSGTRSTRSSTGSSAWASRIPSTRGSATGSTPCSTCRGARPRRSRPISRPRAPCSTPTTTVSTT